MAPLNEPRQSRRLRRDQSQGPLVPNRPPSVLVLFDNGNPKRNGLRRCKSYVVAKHTRFSEMAEHSRPGRYAAVWMESSVKSLYIVMVHVAIFGRLRTPQTNAAFGCTIYKPSIA